MPAPATLTSDIEPRPLTAWLELLEPMAAPVDAGVRDEVLKLLASGGNTAVAAQRMLRDPALVLLLFREANRALARYDREAHTLEHALGLLGVGRVQQLLQKVPTLDPAHPSAALYRAALLRSHHAAAQARLWADGTGLWPAEEVFWSTLLSWSPLWLLCLEAGPAVAAMGETRARQGAISPARIAELIGCSHSALCAALAERWQLPQMSRLSWQPKASGTFRQWVALEHAARLDDAPVIPTRELSELCHHPALVVALANILAEEADWDWYSRRCLRLLSIAATACRRPLATIIGYVHQTAAAVSREHSGGGLHTPGAKLLSYWRQARLWVPDKPPAQEPAKSAAQAAAPADAAPAATSSGDAVLLAATVKQLRDPTRAGGVRETLELAVQALHRGAGFRRVAVLFVRPNGELQTVLSAGAEQAPALRQFRFESKNSQLLTQLLGKPVCLLVDNDNHAKYWPHLPAPLRAAIACDNFALMSVFAQQRAVALIYVDNAPGAIVAAQRQHTLFKQLCQLVGTALSRPA